MKFLQYSAFLLLVPIFQSCLSTSNSTGAGGSTQRNPNVLNRAADYTTIDRVELTNSQTIITITHTNRQQPQYDPRTRKQTNTSNIRIKRDTRLYALNGSRSFRLLNAKGIPVDPQYRTVSYGERTTFTLYFERLEPGIEVFDLFECNDYDNMTCWNFQGIRVKNPAAKEPDIYNDPARGTQQGETEVITQKPQVYIKESVVRGVVKDAKTLKPISAQIDYKLAVKNTKVDSIMSFPGSGEYKVRLQNNQLYSFSVHAPGYLAFVDNIDLTKSVDAQTITRDILLQPIKVGEKITLKNIFFDVAKYEILPASYSELDRLVQLMNDSPTAEIKLEGHTDIIGDAAANLQLSKDRVNEVKKYLVSKGIRSDRITTEGFGSTKPIVAKGTDEERKVNRRVEFVVIKQ
jgi:OmpA-OmpF porin, OOP family